MSIIELFLEGDCSEGVSREMLEVRGYHQQKRQI
jgi:hypothetical protein